MAVFNTKYIKNLAFYLLSYFGIAIMVVFKFAFMLGHLDFKWLNFQNWVENVFGSKAKLAFEKSNLYACVRSQ